MKIRIDPSRAKGEITPPSSKSLALRMLMCAALADGVSIIENVTFSDDVLAMIDCLRLMGAKIGIDKDRVTVEPIKDLKRIESNAYLCRESASTLRFILPLLLISGNEQKLSGSDILMKRPLTVYEEIFKERGFRLERKESVFVQGKLENGEYNVRGDISSQFISGLIFALLMCSGDSRIRIIEHFESASYVNLTLKTVSDFGGDFEIEDGLTILIHGGKRLSARRAYVESDYSSAAFLDAFNLFGGEVKVNGLDEESLQGDKLYKKYFLLIEYGSPNLDISDCPDLAPVLMACASMKHGCRLLNTGRLGFKESSRGIAMAEELSKLGVDIEIKENEIIVHKSRLHAPGEPLHGHNDHRVVMALSVILSVLGGEIDDAQTVSKSYPLFWEDIRRLGIAAKEIYDI